MGCPFISGITGWRSRTQCCPLPFQVQKNRPEIPVPSLITETVLSVERPEPLQPPGGKIFLSPPPPP